MFDPALLASGSASLLPPMAYDPASWLVVLPLLVPALASALAVVFWRLQGIQGLIALAGAAGQTVAGLLLYAAVASGGPLAMAMGNWPAPFGIVFVADSLSALLVIMTGAIGFLVVLYSLSESEGEVRRLPGIYPLLMALLFGVSGAFLTGDLFNLYVWYEVILIASFGLLVTGGGKERIDGTVKYAVLNLLATTLLLIGIALLYGVTGSLTMADLSGKVGALPPDDPTLQSIGLLLLFAFAMKAAAFPLFFWLPAAYHTPLPGIAAIFAALLTKVGVYSVYRVYTLIFDGAQLPFGEVMIWSAIGTMIVAGFGALAQQDIRRLFAYLVMSGVGVMLLGPAIGSEQALVGGILYTLHSIVVMAALFLAGGAIIAQTGSFRMEEIAGLYKKAPLLGIATLVAGLSISGVPPFTGFWAKVYIVQAALAAGENLAAAAVLLSGFLTLVAIGRFWALTFWREETGSEKLHARLVIPLPPESASLTLMPLFFLAAVTAVAGILIGPVTDMSIDAAEGLLNPQAYISSALGGAGQ